MFDDIYKTIDEMSESVFKDRSSRFIGLLYPLSSEEEVKSILSGLKKEHYNATHHCYAYTIGHVGPPAFRINDDGEPSGTAGRPIYGQLLSYELKNVLAVVIRYYGGTKLGVPGLINAYKTTTQLAIQNARILEKTIKDVYKLHFDYLQMNDIMRMLKMNDISIRKNDYQDDKCIIECEVVRSKSDEVAYQLKTMQDVEVFFLKTI
ncbi:MAG: YigZ family protein [Bacteroidales bacterium]|jgi:uncharacterized YigZ family protein|nr:YigZ family protein [Bacteroidales bacterium]